MNQKQRLATQQSMALEAVAKLKAVGGFFGVEDNELAAQASSMGYDEWRIKIEELEKWIFESSPIA